MVVWPKKFLSLFEVSSLNKAVTLLTTQFVYGLKDLINNYYFNVLHVCGWNRKKSNFGVTVALSLLNTIVDLMIHTI